MRQILTHDEPPVIGAQVDLRVDQCVNPRVDDRAGRGPR
jgi:hypothetical protein